MKRKVIAAMLLLSVLLGGCSGWMEGHYVSVEPHTEEGYQNNMEITEVTNYLQLRNALTSIVQSGRESSVISMASYGGSDVVEDMEAAIRYIRERLPIGAYAVDWIKYELGTTVGIPAVALTVGYNHKRAEIGRIRQVEDMEDAEAVVQSALRLCQPSVVMQISNYRTNADYALMVEKYAASHPNKVMEIPQVTANVYPETGSVRVVELVFTYQTDRNSLRSMQNYSESIFDSAALYVSAEDEQHVEFEQLYSFLMERNDYKLETSITPTYSLLRHGVGDSKAFALVYSAMCRQAGLECLVVSGTKEGEPWFWNIICIDGVYRHVDLLQLHTSGGFYPRTDDQMDGYVWDYSSYPVCEAIIEEEIDDSQ